MSFSIRSRFLTTFVVLLAGFMTAVAQRPAPANFMAKVIAEPNAAPYVLLSWKNPEGDAPDKYKIYRYAGQSETESKFDDIGEVEVDPNNPPREGVYTFQVKDLRPGPYTFFVRGVWGDINGARTPFKFVNVQEKPTEGKIWFTSQPKKTGEEGAVYEYDANVEVVGNGTVTFSLLNGPDGMTIDPATGVVRWENPKNGRYEIVIKAVVVIDGKEYVTKQGYVLEIGKGEDRPKFCASIAGTVAFSEQSSTMPKGWVTAWRLDVVKKENGDTVEAYRPVYKAEIKQGSYVLELPNGTYKLRVEGENIIPEWHADVQELADAENVVIECNTRTAINFTVDARPEPTLVVVSGRMYDAATNEPVKGLVIFEARGKEDDGVDSRYRRLVAEIRADGSYEIRVQAGVDYIAFGKTTGRDNAQSEYLAEYWNNTNDGTQASILNVTENTEDIDFPMDKRPVYQNGFSGMMKNVHTSAGIGGKVVAYRLATRVKDNGDTLVNKEKAVTVETDDNFGYSFSNLIPGTYIVFGMPKDRPNVPGWMVLGDTATPEWREATRIEVGEAMLTVQYDILIDTAKGQRGKGRVRGFVYDKRGGIINKGDDRVQNAAAILGSLVVARDENGDIIDFSMSANEGAFELTELAVGNVTITADRVEYESTTQTVTIDANNVDQQISLGLVPVVSSVEVPVDLVGTSLNLYPNPTSTTASVAFTATAGTADVRVMSMTGVVLATQSLTVTGGATLVTIDTASLPSGMVLVQVTNGSTSFALPLQIVR